ncbi:hypothetical protein [Sphingobacterium paramultivorum]|uniref:hypothetical protein n=1 Tax=Sphingobacterium paramultivorum TaxID=2886510 RepID=UPI00129D1941|nr:hypothetical protein [Sphingobacterium paramultivorum]
MKTYLLIAFLACSTLSGFVSCSKSKDSEVQNNTNVVGTWSTADAIEQMTAVFGSDKLLVLTVKSNGKTTSVQTYSYFVEGNKLTTVFIEASPASGKKKGDIDIISISLNGDKLVMGELTYTRVK